MGYETNGMHVTLAGTLHCTELCSVEAVTIHGTTTPQETAAFWDWMSRWPDE